MLVALIVEFVELVASPVDPLVALMQSPTFNADLEIAEIKVKRVEEAKATFVIPLVVETRAPAPPTDATLPVTGRNPAAAFVPGAPPELTEPPAPPVPSEPLLPLELLPQAASSAAVAASTATAPNRRLALVGVLGVMEDTESSFYSLRRASMGASRAARVAG
jgi:hypothetical protein